MPEEKRVSQATGGGKSESAATAKAQTRRSSVSDSLRRFEDAHLNYLQDVRDVWFETQQEFNNAFKQQARKFSESTQNADPQTRFQAYQENVQELQKSVSPEDVQKRFEDAYRNHLRALKDAWANLDVDNIDLSIFKGA